MTKRSEPQSDSPQIENLVTYGEQLMNQLQKQAFSHGLSPPNYEWDLISWWQRREGSTSSLHMEGYFFG